MIKRQQIKELLKSTAFDTEVTVMGWVRTFRNNQFIALNDGSCMGNIQVVLDFNNLPEELLKRITTGAAISATGKLVESLGKGQSVEIKVTKDLNLNILGDSDGSFPIQPKKHSLEFLREKAHLRFRTNTFNAVFKVRHALAFAIHQFFNDRGFVYMHTPIITASDAEGAGEMFKVTTLDFEHSPIRSNSFEQAAQLYYDELILLIQKINSHHIIDNINKKLKNINIDERILGKKNISFKDIVLARENQLFNLTKITELQEIKLIFKNLYESLTTSSFFVKKVGKSSNAREYTYFPDWFLKKINIQRSVQVVRIYPRKDFQFLGLSFFNFKIINKELSVAKDKYVDYSEDFFGKATNLTVSGQLEGELAAMAFGQIYTFGPTFRAENSNTTRHLAEFWMVEPEVAFADLEDNMQLAEDMLKYLIRYALEHCKDEISFLNDRLLEEEKQKTQQERNELSLIQKLNFCIENQFKRLDYTDAIEILQKSKPNQKKQFKYLIDGWGADLQSEHERYLVEKEFKRPVILTNYPADIKSFYMRQNEPDAEGRQTVAAMDILFPGIGEMIGGSQREERYDLLVKRMNELEISTDELKWYLDTRRFGTAKHAGFGLGFERLVLFVTGMTNIRDVIAFPRFPKNAEF